MFTPIFITSCFITNLKLDNETLREQIIAGKDNKEKYDEGHTFSEDSLLPDTPECKKLIQAVDKAIQKNIHSKYSSYSYWAHVLEPNEQTMIHSHMNPNIPINCLSWVYYVDAPKHSGDLAFMFNVDQRGVLFEEKPEAGKLIVFPDWMKHYTKKNNSGKTRVSVSGNAAPKSEYLEYCFKNPENLYSLVGYSNT